MVFQAFVCYILLIPAMLGIPANAGKSDGSDNATSSIRVRITGTKKSENVYFGEAAWKWTKEDKIGTHIGRNETHAHSTFVVKDGEAFHMAGQREMRGFADDHEEVTDFSYRIEVSSIDCNSVRLNVATVVKRDVRRKGLVESTDISERQGSETVRLGELAKLDLGTALKTGLHCSVVVRIDFEESAAKKQ